MALMSGAIFIKLGLAPAISVIFICVYCFSNILYKFTPFTPYRVQRYYFFHGFTKVYIVHPIKIGAVQELKYHLHFGEEESDYQGIFDARITFI